MSIFTAGKILKKGISGIDRLTDIPFTKTGGVGRFLADIGKGEKPTLATKALIGVPTGAELGSFAYDPAEAFFTEATMPATRSQIANHREQLFQMKRQRQLKEELEKYQMKMQEAIRQLALYSPQKYQEVLAGRTLPQDAVVIGGSPRVDLLQQFANDAAMQGLPGPDPSSLNMNPQDPMGELGIGL